MVSVFIGVFALACVVAFVRPSSTVVTSCDIDPTGFVGNLSVCSQRLPIPWRDIRLPNNMLPLHYEIHLHPNLSTFDVTGRTNIRMRARTSTDFIVLHANAMIIKEVVLWSEQKERVEISKLEYSCHAHQIFVGLSTPLSTDDTVVLSIVFEYKLKFGLSGFYLSSYRNEQDKLVYLATTHFEVTGARMAFPCFDEPNFKATYSISIVRNKRHVALSNMPVNLTKSLDDTTVVDYFQESVLMSTYLVAFTICDFKNLSTTTYDGIELSVWAPSHLISQGHFALGVANKTLEYYTKYFNISYPMPKIDMIAIPDFGAGAMENWGLVTYRLSALLSVEDTSSVNSLNWVTTVVAHEISHQWFGNLVTMKWWNDLWLNEGFATYMEYRGANFAKPDFSFNRLFVPDAVFRALNLDSLMNSHKVSLPVSDPDDIEAIFDTISYSKGASVLAMLADKIGETAFQSGLRHYLRTNQYNNTETDDLWHSLQIAYDQLSTDAHQEHFNVKAMMDSWINQKHYPLIHAHIPREQDFVGVKFAQTPFVMLKRSGRVDVASDTQSALWHVPITCLYGDNYRTVYVMSAYMNNTPKHSKTVPYFEKLRPDKLWLLCNANKTGFYRMTYNLDNWRSLQKVVTSQPPLLSSVDRSAILDDCFALNRADVLDASVCLQMSCTLNTSHSITNRSAIGPWLAAASGLSGWLSLLRPHNQSQQEYADLARFVSTIVHVQFTNATDNTTFSYQERMIRKVAFSLLLSAEAESVVAYSQQRFRQWKEKNVRLDPDLKFHIFVTGVKFGTFLDWQYVFDSYIKERSPDERDSLMFAMCATRNVTLIQRLLTMCLNTSIIKTQDIASMLSNLASNYVARSYVFNFMKTEWNSLWKTLGDGAFIIRRVISGVTSRFTTQAELDQVREFFKDKALGGSTRSLNQAIEKIKLNIRWLSEYAPAMRGARCDS